MFIDDDNNTSQSNESNNNDDSLNANLAEASGAEKIAENNPENEGWYIAPEVKGEGEKPEWFNDKQYKSIYDQAKSAIELRKRLGGFAGAPDEYQIDLGEDLKDVELDQEDALLKSFTAFAKENRMSQEAYNNAIKMFVEYSTLQNKHQDKELEEYQKMELDKLGGTEKAKEKINEMCQWFSQNFPNANVQDLKDMMYFADSYNIIRAMRDKMGYAKVPDGKDREALLPAHELRDLQDDPRYLSDPDFQKMVNNQYIRRYS